MDFTPPSSSKIFSSIHCIDVVVILVAEVANQQCEPRAHSLGHITELSRKQMLLRLLQAVCQVGLYYFRVSGWVGADCVDGSKN